MTQTPDRFRVFIADLAELLDETEDDTRILAWGADLLAQLIAHDDWLPEAYAQPDRGRYAQYLLNPDGREHFSVVSFVWGPGQAAPVHDHTVWGLVGVLRGAERSQAYRRENGRLAPEGLVRRLGPGDVEAVSPTIGDLRQVSNARHDRCSISIHVHGGNIGAVRRQSFDAPGRSRSFISGYSNDYVPNLEVTAKEATR